MAKTSVHIEPCNIKTSERYNKREKELNFVRKDLSSLNESFYYIQHSLLVEWKNVAREVKAKTGRNLQKNAAPIKEGVVVIKEDTTMEDLKLFCEKCRTRFGFTPLQIYIHRDEGHSNFKKWKPNLHAHIIWRTYDDNGKSCRLTRQNFREIQTLASEILDMERGFSSDIKHLNALQFRVVQQEKRIEELNLLLSEAQADREGIFTEGQPIFVQESLWDEYIKLVDEYASTKIGCKEVKLNLDPTVVETLRLIKPRGLSCLVDAILKAFIIAYRAKLKEMAATKPRDLIVFRTGSVEDIIKSIRENE